MLRFLVGAACIVIIASGVYFAWSEYDRRNARIAADERAQYLALAQMCKQMHRELDTNEIKEDWRIAHVAKCVRNGHLSEDDFAGPHMIGILDQARNLIASDVLD